jgi:hemolysin activation/secretion protein
MYPKHSICSAVAIWLSCCGGAIASPAPPTTILEPGPIDLTAANYDGLLAQASLPQLPQTPELPKIPENVPTPDPPPILEIPTPQPQEEAPAPEELRISVKRITIKGSSVFSQRQLDQITAPYIGRELGYEELLQIRSAITDLYVKKGYVTSGAYLPEQDVTSGEIIIQVLEGQVEEVQIQGLTFLRSSYVRDRIKRSTRTPLNIERLEAGLQLLQADPLIETIQAELKPGSRLNKSVLTLNLKEAQFLNGSYSVENRDSPSTGEWRHTLSFVNQNLTSNGDRLSIDLAFTAGAQNYSFDYSYPLNALDGSIFARYEQGHQEIIEAPFQGLGINSESESVSFGIRQPIIREPSRDFVVSLSADIRRSKTFIFDDIPFSFSQGVEDGVSKVRALRFTPANFG